jgi:hypothetical protein
VRTKVAGFVLLLALGIAVAATVTGQEEPLPTVHSRAFAVEPASIVLAVEPIRVVQQPTLADAVRRNDYLTFHALYQESQPAEYRTLHELWTWAMSDPTGAFYGRDMHDRLARAYPGYASYIETFRIVDSRGNVFYPTSETRTFLLQRAMEREAPRVQLATTSALASKANVTATTKKSATRATAPTKRASNATTPKTATHATTPKTATHATTTKTATHAPSTKNRRSSSASPRHSAQSTAPKAAVTTAQTTPPAIVAATPVATPATTPAATPASTTPNGGEGAGVGGAPAATPIETAPVATTPAEPVPTTAAQPVATTPVDAAAGRTPNSGILLLVIGLIGVGLLAVILRTPREAQPTSILQPPPPADASKPAASVEPIRRPADEKSRATGSRG